MLGTELRTQDNIFFLLQQVAGTRWILTFAEVLKDWCKNLRRDAGTDTGNKFPIPIGQCYPCIIITAGINQQITTFLKEYSPVFFQGDELIDASEGIEHGVEVENVLFGIFKPANIYDY